MRHYKAIPAAFLALFLLLVPLHIADATVNHQVPYVTLIDASGNPYSGAKAYFYDPGTTTPRTVYTNAALSIPHSSPVVADSAGRLPVIYLPAGTYKVRYETSAGVLIEQEDNVDPGQSTSAGALAVANGGTGSTTAAGARSNLSAASQAALDALDLRVDATEALLAAPILAPVSAQTFAASFTPVFTTSQTRSVTLTGTITFNAPTVTAGQRIRLVIIQDATGNRTAAWNSAYKWPAGLVGTLSTTADAVDVLEGYARSTSIVEVTSFKRQDVTTNYAVVEDQKSANTDGGTFTSGADRTRDLNTEVTDTSGLVTVASNQITITNAGTYQIDWSAPAKQVDEHQSFLYNVTSTTEVKRGTSEISPTAAASRSFGSTVVTISGATVFEIRHRALTTRATDGFGYAGNFGTEVYTQVSIKRMNR